VRHIVVFSCCNHCCCACCCSLGLPAALITKQQVHLQALLADLLLPLHTAAAAAATFPVDSSAFQQQQQQQMHQVQLSVLSKVQGFVQAVAAARHEQEQQQLAGMTQKLSKLHATLQQLDEQPETAFADDHRPAAFAAGAASGVCSCGAHVSSSSSGSSDHRSNTGNAAALRAALVDPPDAAELIGIDSMKLLLELKATQQQQQQGQEQQQQVQHLMQESVQGLQHKQELLLCRGFESLVPERCRLEYWRICVDAQRQQPSKIDSCKQLQETCQLSSCQLSWERLQLRELLEQHAGLAGKEAEQLAAVSCKLSQQLLALEACSAAAAGCKPVVLRRSLVRCNEAPTLQRHEISKATDDPVAEDTAAMVARGVADGQWYNEISRTSTYELLPGMRSQCVAAAAGKPSGLAECALAAGRAGPIAAYGLAVRLVREALGKLPTLEQALQQQQQQQGCVADGSDDEGDEYAPEQLAARGLLRSVLLPRLQLLRRLQHHVQQLLAAAESYSTPSASDGLDSSFAVCSADVFGAPDAAHLLRQDFQQQESLQQLLLLAAGVQTTAGAAAAVGGRRNRAHGVIWRSLLPAADSTAASTSRGSSSNGIADHPTQEQRSHNISNTSSSITAEATAAAITQQLRSMCAAHQGLLAAVQESSDGFGLGCSLHPTQCPAGGQKWLAAAAALQHTWQQQVEALLHPLLGPGSSSQQQQQLGAGISVSGNVHSSAPKLLAGLEAALCCWVGQLLQAGSALQAADAEARQHELIHRQLLDKFNTLALAAVVAATPPGGTLSTAKFQQAMGQHSKIAQQAREAGEEGEQLAKQLKESRQAWQGAVEAVQMFGDATLQLLVLLQRDLALDVLLIKLQQQQQQQQGEQESSTQRRLAQLVQQVAEQRISKLVRLCVPGLQLLWQLSPLLLSIGSMQQPAAETAAEQLVMEALQFGSSSGRSPGLATPASTAAAGARAAAAADEDACQASAQLTVLTDSALASPQLLQLAECFAVEDSMLRAAAAALGAVGSMMNDSSDTNATAALGFNPLLIEILTAANPAREVLVQSAAGEGQISADGGRVAGLLLVRCTGERVGLLVEKHAEQRQQLLRQARQLTEEQQQQMATLLRCLGGSSSSGAKLAAAAADDDGDDSARMRLQQLLILQKLTTSAAAAAANGSTAEQATTAAVSALPADAAVLLADAAKHAAVHHRARTALWQFVNAVKPSAARAVWSRQLPEICRSQVNLEGAVLQWPPAAVAAAAAGLQQSQQQGSRRGLYGSGRSSSSGGGGSNDSKREPNAAAAGGAAACCICGKDGSSFNAYVLPTSLQHAAAAHQQLSSRQSDSKQAAIAADSGCQMLLSAVCGAAGCVSAVLAALAASGPPLLHSEEIIPQGCWQAMLQLVRTDLLQFNPGMR
jgi:hypothetical protein